MCKSYVIQYLINQNTSNSCIPQTFRSSGATSPHCQGSKSLHYTVGTKEVPRFHDPPRPRSAPENAMIFKNLFVWSCYSSIYGEFVK